MAFRGIPEFCREAGAASGSSASPLAGAGIDADLTQRLGPIEPVLAGLDPALVAPTYLTGDEFEELLAFVRDGLADPRVSGKNLCRLIPATLPSGRAPPNFTECWESSGSE
jgi:hypothetical protein